MTFSSGAFGIMLMLFAGVINTTDQVVSRLLEEAGWPYWKMMLLSCVLTALGMGIYLAYAQTKLPRGRKLAWVFLRSFFGISYWALAVVAVQIGASAGDVAALTSMNIVVAAAFAHVFLSEQMCWMHNVALIASIMGALLIAKPSFLFGTSSGRVEGQWIAYVCALLSGVTQGCYFISSRMSVDVSDLLLACCELSFGVPLSMVLFCFPFVKDESLSLVLDAPLKGTAFLLCLILVTLLAISFATAGASRCPAALSATIYTAAQMITGYSVDFLMFGKTLQPLTLLGALLMLSAVAIMAGRSDARSDCEEAVSAPASRPAQETCRQATEDLTIGEPSSHTDDRSDTDFETESLSSFIASEFVEFTPSAARSVRSRRPVIGAGPACQTIGAPAKVLPAAPVVLMSV